MQHQCSQIKFIQTIYNEPIFFNLDSGYWDNGLEQAAYKAFLAEVKDLHKFAKNEDEDGPVLPINISSFDSL